MDNINLDDEYGSNVDANTFFSFQDFDSYFEEGASVGYYDSSSPDGAHDQSSPPSKNRDSERSRRDKLNQRLYALRSVVPNITKLDKASIVKDAIGYIESLHEEERKIKAEIAEMESSNSTGISYLDHQEDEYATRMDHYNHSPATLGMPPPSHPIQLLELKVRRMRERIIVVSLTCSKRRETMVKLCEIFESLNLKIITANISAGSGRLFNTVFLQGGEEETEVLKSRISAAFNDPDSPMTM